MIVRNLPSVLQLNLLNDLLMYRSRLVTLLRTLDQKEWRALHKWLESPAHNQREDVRRLARYLSEKGHLSRPDALRKEAVWEQIFGTVPYDDERMRQVMHFLLKAVEDMLLYHTLIADRVRTMTTLASVFRRRGLDKLFESTMKQVRKLQARQPWRNELYFRNQYLIEQEQYSYQSGFRRLHLNLQEMSDALDLTYIVDKLRQSCLMLAHQTVYQADYRIGLIDAVLAHVAQHHLLCHPAIAIYYHIYHTLADREQERHFFELRAQIEQHHDKFPQAEMRDIYLFAINYCIGRINAGKESFIRQAFELYRSGLEQGLLIESRGISVWTFRNVVTNGVYLGEFEWVSHFIDEYQHLLEEKFRHSTVLYCRAQLHFARKEYDEAMRLLAQSDFDDILINLRAKTMLARMYFEEGEFEALESLLESMRTYMQRKKVMGYHRANFQNFLKLTRRLVRLNPFDKGKRDELKREIESAQPMTLSEKQWLLTQLEQM